MSAELYTGTELAVTTPEIWDRNIEDARYKKSVMIPLVSNKSDVVREAGDIIHVPIAVKRTVGSVSLTTGGFTPRSLTPTEAQLTVNQWLEVSEKITDAAKKQSFYDPQSDFGKAAVKALMEKYDEQLLALWDQFAQPWQQIGDAGKPKAFSKAHMLAALLRLSKRDIPKNELNFVLAPDCFYAGIMNEAQLTDVDKAGIEKNLLTEGFRGVFKLVGVPAYESNSVVSSGSTLRNLLLHKSAMAIAMQINNKYETTRLTATGVLGDLWVMQTLDGVKAIRTDHAAVIHTLTASETATI